MIFHLVESLTEGLTDFGQLISMGFLVTCIVFSKSTINWIFVFWFPKSIDKNNKSQKGIWNRPLGVTVTNEKSSFGHLIGLVVLGLITFFKSS